MVDMARRQILPAVIRYNNLVCGTLSSKMQIGIGLDLTAETELAKQLSELSGCLSKQIEELERSVSSAKDIEDALERAKAYKDVVLPNMDALRQTADSLELITAKEYWPFPTYEDLMF